MKIALFSLLCLYFSSSALSADDVLRVDSILLKSVSLPQQIRLDGTLTARRQADVSAEIGGTIKTRHIELGQWVKKGQVLLALDPQRLQIQQKLRRAEYAVAQQRLDLATKTWQRVSQLHSDSTASEEEADRAEFELNTARAQLQAAQAALDLTQLDLQNSELQAPFAGEVAAILTDVGERIAPGQPLVRLAATDSLILRAAVSAQDLYFLERGLAAEVKPSDGSTAFTAMLHSFSRVADPQSRRYPIELIAANGPQNRRALGALASIIITSNQRIEGVLVSEDALRSFAGQTYAYVLSERDGQTRLNQRPVSISRELQGGLFLISEGLAAGELIAAGGALMADGLRVEIKSAQRELVAPKR
jgi:RND family efflux transporter MFP subunit